MDKKVQSRFEELKAGGLLPSPLGLAAALLEITSRADGTVQEVAHLVQADPAMSGRILRYANSAHAAPYRQIVSLEKAITFLGLFRIRQIVLVFTLMDQYRSGKCAAFDYEAYWSISLATGIAAQKLASHAHSPQDESFTCGLLSGIGRLGLATAFPEQYEDILRQPMTLDALLDTEQSVFGIDHAKLTQEMLRNWGIPDIFTEAIRYHEQPQKSPFAPDSRGFAMVSSLYLAMRIGHLLNLNQQDRWQQAPSLYHAAAQFGVESNEIPALIESVVETWQTWTRELSLPSKPYTDLRQLLTTRPTTLDQAPDTLQTQEFRLAIIVADQDLCGKVANALKDSNYTFQASTSLDEFKSHYSNNWPDVVIVDVADVLASQIRQIHELKSMAGPAMQIVALIPAKCEADVAHLMAAGACDYLVHEFSQAALSARLINLQRLVVLQSAVRTERELTIHSSGEWGRTNRRLLQTSLTDMLTSLPNRRYGMDRFEQEWSVASSNALPLSCLMVDIDHFKLVNDKRGHNVGDIVIKQVAYAIGQNCRRSDVVFRYGGEEFCCICPETRLAEAVQLAERIVQAISTMEISAGGDLFNVTVSIGVAERLPAMKEPTSLIAVSDKALYAAKKAGRNNCHVHTP